MSSLWIYCKYLLVMCLVWFLVRFKNYFRSVYIAWQLPGPKPVPILGNVFIVNQHKKLEYIAINSSKLYGPLIRVWLSVVPLFLVTEPQYLQQILCKNKQSTKNFFYRLLHNFIGEGLITISGPKWKAHRKLLQPFFQTNILELLFATVHKYSVVIVDDLKDKSDVNIVLLTNKFVLHMLHKAVFGIPVKNNGKVNPFRDSKFILPHRISRPWLLLDSIFKVTNSSKSELLHKEIIQNYTKTILDSKRNSNKNDTCFMEFMLEASENDPLKFSGLDVSNEASTLMLAGQDSIGSALAFCFHFIAKEQGVQEKIVAELESVFGDSQRTTHFEDIANMKYLEQCIKEVLRLCPTVPIIARTLTEDMKFGKIVLPAGSNILVCPFVTHRLPHIFSDPLKFDPDRFSPENLPKIHPFGYIPFSAGPRNCVGNKFALLQLKTVMVEVLRKYHISIVPGHEELNYIYRLPTLKASGGIWIQVKERPKRI